MRTRHSHSSFVTLLVGDQARRLRPSEACSASLRFKFTPLRQVRRSDGAAGSDA